MRRRRRLRALVRHAGLLGGLAVFGLLLALPLPGDPPVAAQRCVAVLGLCVVWWFTGPVPLPVTSMVGMALVAVLGVLSPGETLALFGNQAVFFIVGVFIMAAVMTRTGLARRLALHLLQLLSGSEERLALGVLLLATLLCSVIVSHAVAAMLLPIVLEIIAALHLTNDGRLARRLLLSMAWGTVVGSNLTLLGSARAGLALGIFADFGGHSATSDIGFLDFSLAALPMVALSTAGGWVVLRLAFPPEGVDTRAAYTWLHQQVVKQGSISRRELATIAVLVLMVAALALWGQQVGMGSIALLGAGSLFALRLAEWDEVEQFVSWGTILMFGGAVALAGALERSGAITWAVHGVLANTDTGGLVALAVLSYAALILTEVASNSAVIVLMLPMALGMAGDLGIDPRMMVFMTVFASGAAHVLPTSTPAMSMVFSTGYLRSRDTLVAGLILNHICWAALMLSAWLLWPMLLSLEAR